MKVWVLSIGYPYEGSDVEAVFSSEANLNNYINENYPDYRNGEHDYDLIVQEVELDKKIGS